MVGELTSLHRIPERELQMLLNTLNPSSRSPAAAAELLQQITPTQAVIDGRSDDAVKRYWAEEPPILEPDSGISKSAGAATRSRRKPVNGKDISRSLLLRKALPTDVWQRMQHLEEVMQKNKQNTLEKLRSVSSESLERQLNSQRRIHAPSEKDTGCQDDVCLPALFMPTKLGHLFSPKAHLYFHPSGSGATLRLTQPPSMLSLPPLSGQNKLSVLNLLDPGVSLPSYSGRRRSGKNAWADSTQWKEAPTALSKGVREPPNGKDLYGQLQGGALEDTGDQLKGSQLVEKIVGDDLVINEAFPALEKDVAETPVGKKLLQKINGPELTDSISPVGKYAGEALVDTHVLDYVA
ncbi:uncharacterized protein [Ambystoma mexicanum]|uniref:uncharacterized protein n=1 Tax=Ambystoma mexicanum TaxID=8296 RepID=UPI0037E8263E